MDYGVVGSEEKQEIVCLYMFFPSEVASHYEQLHSPGYSLAHGNENNLFNIHVILMTIDPIFFSFSFTQILCLLSYHFTLQLLYNYDLYNLVAEKATMIYIFWWFKK